MELTPFLNEIFTKYTEACKPLEERARIESELQAAREACAKLEEALAQHSVTNDDIAKFLINAEELMGGHATEAVLMNMLVAKFGGPSEKPKRRGRRKKVVAAAATEGAGASGGAPDGAPAEQASEGAPTSTEITRAEKDLIASVMTMEPMSITEVAAATSQHTGDEWLSSDVSPILKAMIKDGSVVAQGEKRGKRYMLSQMPTT